MEFDIFVTFFHSSLHNQFMIYDHRQTIVALNDCLLLFRLMEVDKTRHINGKFGAKNPG